MPLDTATLALSGDVPFEKFADAVRRFYDLIEGLTVETGATSVVWVVDELECWQCPGGSARYRPARPS